MTQSDKKTAFPYWARVVVVFFFGWVSLYAARSVFSPVIGEIQSEFGLSQKEAGGMMSLFFLTYTALQIPSGILGDKIGRLKVLIPGFFLFAITLGLINWVSGYFAFMAMWMLVGAFQGTYYGPQYALSSEALPKKWITVGSAIIGAGMSFGISLGYYTSSYMVNSLGTSWKSPFLVMAFMVGAVALFMALVLREKAPPADESSAPAQAASTEQSKEEFRFADLFSNRNLVMAYITIFCSIYGFFVIITWLPYYLEHERGMDKEIASYYASLVPWISILGTLIASYVSDRLGKRKPVALSMLPLSLVAIFGIVYSTSDAMLLAMLVLYGFIGKISLNPVLVALVADNAPKSSLSTAFSFYNFFGMASSIVAPFATGWLGDVTGSLNSGFYCAAVITVIGIIAMLFVNENYDDKAVKQ